MNNRMKVNDSLRAEIKSVSPNFSDPERFGIKVSNYCIVDKYTGEKPVYLTKNGVEIESWELPNLPEAYLDQVCWPKDIGLEQIANEGLTEVPGLKGRYLKPLNRSYASYSGNTMLSSGITTLVYLLDGSPTNLSGVSGPVAYRTGLGIPDSIFLTTDTSVVLNTPTVADLTGTTNTNTVDMNHAGTGGAAFSKTVSDDGGVLDGSNEVNKISYNIVSGEGSNNSPTGGWNGAGLYERSSTVGNITATDPIFNSIDFSGGAVNKTANDTLSVTIGLKFS